MPLNNPSLTELAKRAKKASRELVKASSAAKNEALLAAADALGQASDHILSANQKDLNLAKENRIPEVLMDRLALSPARIEQMAEGLRQVAELSDPIGEVIYEYENPNQLKISQVRVPLGVVAVIYESRPNVTSDSAGLCIKSSNAAFLRGSGAAIFSNTAIEAAMREAIEGAGLPADALILVKDTRHESAVEYMQLRKYVDCLIPRGGSKLIQSILDNATVPYVIDGEGNCHIYVDASANLEMAGEILVNAKTQRPSVCNAAESLLVHTDIAEDFLPEVAKALSQVKLVGDKRAIEITSQIQPAEEGDFAQEFLDLKMSVKVVDTIAEAIEHINENNTGHSEAIVAESQEAAEIFVNQVDAGSVLVNASTRFVDGQEFGFGAEIGISTQKLHARGPLGLKQLTSTKFVVQGSGQIRI